MFHSIAFIWFEFVTCAVLIGVAGTKLSRYADVIADKTGLSGSWVGLILLATVTSLPELVTGISALTLAHAPDIAVGGVMGSCVFNLAILVILDFMIRGESVYHRAHRNHLLTAGFGIALIGFAGLSILLASMGLTINISFTGIYTPIIMMLYLVAMRALFVREHTQIEHLVEQVASRYPDLTLRQASIGYAISALVVIAAGVYLPVVCAQLAEIMGWHNSFVGTLFVAGVTSLPELAVTIAAVRMGALDMAVANLLGSNLFNILVLAIDDVIFIKGALLSHISVTHAVSALSAVIMTGFIIIGLIYRPTTRLMFNIGWISIGLMVLYLLNTYVLFIYG
ncbi:MAG: sodium:calcium antiporter [Nitrosomonas sp.]|nr:sodium:calcium antiporter [Nitrosomonas sp.]